MEQKITAGRDELGSFAPKFAQLNDDVLFGGCGHGRRLSPPATAASLPSRP